MSRQRTAYIHIGMDMAGTASLQSFFTAHATQLRDHGLDYPCGAGANIFNHVEFASQHGFNWDGSATEETSWNAGSGFKDFTNDPNLDLLISSETFCVYVSITSLQRLKAWLDRNGFERVTVIVYLRNQVDWLVSIYSEWLKWDHKEDFPLFYQIVYSRLRYRHLLDHWSSVFGADNLRVMNYDREHVRLCDILIHLVGLSSVPEIAEKVATHTSLFTNSAMSQIILEFIRGLTVPLSRHALYDSLVARIGDRRPAFLVDLYDQKIWHLPRRFLDDIALLEDHNVALADDFKVEKLPDLSERAATYEDGVRDLDHDGLVTAATMLLWDLQSLPQ